LSLANQGDNFDLGVGQPILAVSEKAAPDLSRSGTGRLESRPQARVPGKSACPTIPLRL
jgi:hypothetical protein